MFVSDRQSIIGSAKVSKFGDGSSNLNMQASYTIPMKQIEELIRLSDSCTQEFQWDCYIAPLEIRGDKLLSWTDRKGESQFYYHGNGSENVNACKCLETNTCNQAFGINFNCNCNR